MERYSVVTGGSGFFGARLCQIMLARGDFVRVFDLNPPGFSHPRLEYRIGDIRDPAAVQAACEGAETVYHNVAQVPLAKDKDLFWTVNRDGTQILIDGAIAAGVRKLVYTSSSAVFGIPLENPVTEDTDPRPAEDYGRAKLAGEMLCRDAMSKGLDVVIIRPRTILGHGRLGVVQILFDWVSRGADVPVLGDGNNLYQFVHADDLARACIAASDRAGSAIYNIGAEQFGTMRELLQALIDHAGTASRIKSIPLAPAEFLANVTAALGLSPLGPYHSLMYGRSLYFDVSKAKAELGWSSSFSNAGMICETYDWYMRNRESMGGENRSHHQSPVKQGVLAYLPHILRWMPA